ncbi:hypothetical protein Slin15195_G114670 [Septoria linicola]|uniref:Uncharacterized protein n=1 Tax=Septoria linicola TaxID=215465 RepID=A0A9Q9B399_9PEZI|nr:hypothetical protein Slin14017_G122650 [Septoria linicola]USW58148.1 hypothetical protein Slin15195_G114670 [Septoria linicola]
MSSNIEKIIAYRKLYRANFEPEFQPQVDILSAHIKPAKLPQELSIEIPKHICSCKEKECHLCQIAFRGIGPEEALTAADDSVYETLLDDDEAETKIEQFVTSIKETHERLRGLIDRRGNQVLEAWKNMSVGGRHALLTAAMPGISSVRWPQKWLHMLTTDWVEDRKQRTAFLLPYLDLPTLTEDSAYFLRILHHATSEMPHSWCRSTFDYETLEDGMLGQNFNAGQVDITAAGFGTYSAAVICYELHCGNAIGYPHAEVLLDSQAKLLNFLARAVAGLLHNRKVVRGQERWTTAAAMQFTDDIDTTEHYINAAWSLFRLPIDSEQLLELASERRKTALDDLILLQLDPTVVQRRVAAIERREVFSKYSDGARWAYFAHHLYSRALARHHVWDAVEIRLKEFSEASKLQKTAYDPSGEAACYMRSILVPSLNKVKRQMLEQIRSLLPTVSAFEWHYDYGKEKPVCKFGKQQPRAKQAGGPPKGTKQKAKKAAKKQPFEEKTVQTFKEKDAVVLTEWKSDPLFWPVQSQVVIRGARYTGTPQSALVREQMDSTASVDREFLQAVEDLHILEQIMGTICFSPGRRFNVDEDNLSPAIRTLYADLTANFPTIALESPQGLTLDARVSALPSQHCLALDWENEAFRPEGLALAANALRGLCENAPWPQGTTKTLSWLRAASLARLKLSKFWEATIAAHIRGLEMFNPGKSHLIQTSRDVQLLSQNRSRTHCEKIRKEIEEIEAKEKKLDEAREAGKRRIDEVTGSGSQGSPPKKQKYTTDKKSKEEIKAEQKLLQKEENTPQQELVDFLGQIQVDLPTPEPSPTEGEFPSAETPTAFIKVNKSHMKVFDRLWPHDSMMYGGSVRWPDFVSAMQAAVCTMKKIDGSEFRFTKDDVTNKSSMVIHRAHRGTTSTIDSDYLQQWGRRITRNFKWTYESFTQ